MILLACQGLGFGMLDALATAASGVARLIKLLGQGSESMGLILNSCIYYVGYVQRYYVVGFNRKYLLGYMYMDVPVLTK